MLLHSVYILCAIFRRILWNGCICIIKTQRINAEFYEAGEVMQNFLVNIARTYVFCKLLKITNKKN